MHDDVMMGPRITFQVSHRVGGQAGGACHFYIQVPLRFPLGLMRKPKVKMVTTLNGRALGVGLA